MAKILFKISSLIKMKLGQFGRTIKNKNIIPRKQLIKILNQIGPLIKKQNLVYTRSIIIKTNKLLIKYYLNTLNQLLIFKSFHLQVKVNHLNKTFIEKIKQLYPESLFFKNLKKEAIIYHYIYKLRGFDENKQFLEQLEKSIMSKLKYYQCMKQFPDILMSLIHLTTSLQLLKIQHKDHLIQQMFRYKISLNRVVFTKRFSIMIMQIFYNLSLLGKNVCLLRNLKDFACLFIEFQMKMKINKLFYNKEDNEESITYILTNQNKRKSFSITQNLLASNFRRFKYQFQKNILIGIYQIDFLITGRKTFFSNLSINHQPIILQFNGPEHYSVMGELIIFSDIKKIHLQQLYKYKVIFLSFYRWQKLQNEFDYKKMIQDLVGF